MEKSSITYPILGMGVKLLEIQVPLGSEPGSL
jgi:hypothetical protein